MSNIKLRAIPEEGVFASLFVFFSF